MKNKCKALYYSVRSYTAKFFKPNPYLFYNLITFYWTSLNWIKNLFKLLKVSSIFNIEDSNYEILVEGYPRCGNTYVCYMLLLSQKERILHSSHPRLKHSNSTGIRLSSHWHSVASVMSAIKQKKPVCLVIRNPEDAILSWHLSFGSGSPNFKPDLISLENRIEYYISFYGYLLKYKHKLYAASFDTFTVDFKSIVLEIERKFRLNLVLDFDENQIKLEAENQITLLDASYDDKLNTRIFHLPSAERKKEKEDLRMELLSIQYADRLLIANQIYRKFLAKDHDNSLIKSSCSITGD